MPTTDCATNIALPDSQIPDAQSEDVPIEAARRASNGASKPLKGLFFGFTATVTVGLALASWYVGVRIVAADEVALASTTTGSPVNVSPAPTPAAATPSVSEDSMAEAYWYSVPPAYLYVQVAGLGLKPDADFASSLQAKGFRAQVQMRDGATTRILIGPFSTHAEMEQGQRKLRSAGLPAVETAY
jgi:cell division septation protein DedD